MRSLPLLAAAALACSKQPSPPPAAPAPLPQRLAAVERAPVPPIAKPAEPDPEPDSALPRMAITEPGPNSLASLFNAISSKIETMPGVGECKANVIDRAGVHPFSPIQPCQIIAFAATAKRTTMNYYTLANDAGKPVFLDGLIAESDELGPPAYTVGRAFLDYYQTMDVFFAGPVPIGPRKRRDPVVFYGLMADHHTYQPRIGLSRRIPSIAIIAALTKKGLSILKQGCTCDLTKVRD